MEVKLYELGTIDDTKLKYAIIVTRYKEKWVFCKNKVREWELPGGHREQGEDIEETAKRELFEETGALKYNMIPICTYSITDYGALFFAEILEFGNLPESEIERIGYFEDVPKVLSFPSFHPVFFNKVKEFLKCD